MRTLACALRNATEMSIPSGTIQSFTINGSSIVQCSSFKYLGSWIEDNAACEKDVSSRIGAACATFNSLHKVLWSSEVSTAIKLRVYLATVRPTLLYGAGNWPLTGTQEKKLDTADRRFLRRVLGLFYPNIPHNVDLYASVNAVYSRMKKAPSVIPTPSQQAASDRVRLLGHILRRADDRLVKE